MDIGLHHGRIDPHLTTRCDLAFLCDFHHPPMQLFDHLRPQLTRQVSHCSIIRNLFAADPGEFAIDQIGAHFPRQHFVTPVAHMLQQQHSEHNLGRRRLAPTSLALLAAFGQLLLDDEQEGVILQRCIGVSHPGFPEILHRLGDEAIGEISL